MNKRLNAINQPTCMFVYGIDESARFRLSIQASLDRNQELTNFIKNSN
jgi:hypothetical protein